MEINDLKHIDIIPFNSDVSTYRKIQIKIKLSQNRKQYSDDYYEFFNDKILTVYNVILKNTYYYFKICEKSLTGYKRNDCYVTLDSVEYILDREKKLERILKQDTNI